MKVPQLPNDILIPIIQMENKRWVDEQKHKNKMKEICKEIHEFNCLPYDPGSTSRWSWAPLYAWHYDVLGLAPSLGIEEGANWDIDYGYDYGQFAGFDNAELHKYWRVVSELGWGVQVWDVIPYMEIRDQLKHR